MSGRAVLGGALRYAPRNVQKHPVRIDIAGTVESISHITAELLYKCYDTFYNLSNMVLCVAGNVDVDTVLSVADKVLKKQPEKRLRENSTRSRKRSAKTTWRSIYP